MSDTYENRYKSQSSFTKYAIENTGSRDEAIKAVADALQQGLVTLKESKKAELDGKGEKGYLSYAKVKVREYEQAEARRQAKSKE